MQSQPDLSAIHVYKHTNNKERKTDGIEKSIFMKLSSARNMIINWIYPNKENIEINQVFYWNDMPSHSILWSVNISFKYFPIQQSF